MGQIFWNLAYPAAKPCVASTCVAKETSLNQAVASCSIRVEDEVLDTESSPLPAADVTRPSPLGMTNQPSFRANSVNSNEPSGHEAQRSRRPFLIDEALQRTPLTSINPFHPEIIPIPAPIPSTLCPTSLTRRERAAGRLQLQELDNEVGKSRRGHHSTKLAQTLNDVRFLLTESEGPIK